MPNRASTTPLINDEPAASDSQDSAKYVRRMLIYLGIAIALAALAAAFLQWQQ